MGNIDVVKSFIDDLLESKMLERSEFRHLLEQNEEDL